MWQNRELSSEDDGTDAVCPADKNIAPFLEEARRSQGSGNIRPTGGQELPRLKPISGGDMLAWLAGAGLRGGSTPPRRDGLVWGWTPAPSGGRDCPSGGLSLSPLALPTS